MAGNFWPVVVEKADTNLRYRVKPIPSVAVDEYLSKGGRVSRKGITLYHQPKPSLEVGFLIKRKAGNAVRRNHTRRLFWGTILNHDFEFIPDRGYLFLFHNGFSVTGPLYEAINGLIAQANQSRQ